MELGWSRPGRYPELSMRPSPEAHDCAEAREEYLVRLALLTHGHDHWWEIEPFRFPRDPKEALRTMQPIPADEARARVVPVVDEVLTLLERDGEPYLERIAQRQLRAADDGKR